MRIFSASFSAWSISSTRAPRWPAIPAQNKPAAPAPITTTSYECIAGLSRQRNL